MTVDSFQWYSTNWHNIDFLPNRQHSRNPCLLRALLIELVCTIVYVRFDHLEPLNILANVLSDKNGMFWKVGSEDCHRLQWLRNIKPAIFQQLAIPDPSQCRADLAIPSTALTHELSFRTHISKFPNPVKGER
eukprot:766490-Hanusia_phi.AAC.3